MPLPGWLDSWNHFCVELHPLSLSSHPCEQQPRELWTQLPSLSSWLKVHNARFPYGSCASEHFSFGFSSTSLDPCQLIHLYICIMPRPCLWSVVLVFLGPTGPPLSHPWDSTPPCSLSPFFSDTPLTIVLSDEISSHSTVPCTCHLVLSLKQDAKTL